MFNHDFDCIVKRHIPVFFRTVFKPIIALKEAWDNWWTPPMIGGRTVIGTKSVSPGDSNHCHSLKLKEWDPHRFGPEVLVDDPRYSGGLHDSSRHHDDPPLATYLWLFGCKCGAEIIQEVRALI